MRGFKSSGPRALSVNFEKGFAVITGPNGSGKSNIADAIMFAIGENSPKQLRAANGRLSGLIYDPRKEDATPAQRPKECRVTLQFDNADRAIPVDSDLVTVTRELRESGENVYYLNGRKTTRGSLTEILDLAGLSPGGLNIVPQGAATKVVDLTPEEKRRMIEEVVGIAKFDERKAEAQRQLSQADQRLEVAMARIGEMKSTLEQLDAQRNDLIRHEALENQINWLTAVNTTRRINGLRERLSSLRANEQELNARVQELNGRLSDHESKIAEVENEKTRFIVEVVQGGGASHVDLQFQLAEVDNELNSAEADLGVAEENVRVLEGETVPQLKEVVSAKQKQVTASNSVIRQLTAESQKLEEKNGELSTRLRDLMDAEGTLHDTIERKGKLKARLQARLDEVGQKLNDVELSINRVGASLGAESKRLDELKLRVDGYSQVLEKLESNTKKLLDLHEGSSKELDTIETDLSSAEDTRSRLLDSIESASKTLERASAEMSKEEAYRKISKSLSGERTGQTKLQELCENGGVPGYVGRLNQLIRFPQGYSKAVTAVLGRWMGAFVVEDLRSMTQLIKAAKSMKAKAYSVIPLSEVEGCAAAEVDRSAGVVGPLSGVIKAEKKYGYLLNFLAGDSVLVESEAIGYLLSSEGVRAVTMDGETFEPGGRAFTFGYQEILMNLMEGLEDIEGLGEIEDAVGALKGAIDRRKTQLQSIESDSRLLMKDRIRKIVSATSLKAEASAISRMAKRYKTIFRTMNNEYQKQARVVQTLQKQLGSFTAKRDEMSADVASMRAEVSEIDELGLGSMLAEVVATRQGLAVEADSLRNRLSEASLSLSMETGTLENVLLRTLEENDTDLTNALEDLKSNKEFVRETPRRIRELRAQKESLESQISKLKESSKKSQPVLDEFDTRARRLREERDAVSRSIAGAQKEAFAVASQAESTQERVEEALGSLRMLGYTEEPEVFDSSDQLLSELEAEYQVVVSSVNRSADRQYRDMFTGYKNLSVRNNELEKERNAIIAFIESVEAEKRTVFTTAFEVIGTEFKTIFNRLTGGQAWLELERPDEIFSGGLMLYARFGNKPEFESVSLSGGEKAVSGVSLILAMQGVQPHPFYLFDEIDAALDAVNSANLAHFLKERSQRAQIVGITLRDVFVAQSDVTYGAYSAGGVTRLVHYKPAEVPVNSG